MMCKEGVGVAVSYGRGTLVWDGVVEAVPAEEATEASLQGYLAHKKGPNPLGPP